VRKSHPETLRPQIWYYVFVRKKEEGNKMKVYIVCEFLDYYNSDIVAVFSNEEDAKNYVQEHYWRDGDGDGIYYEEHEVK